MPHAESIQKIRARQTKKDSVTSDIDVSESVPTTESSPENISESVFESSSESVSEYEDQTEEETLNTELFSDLSAENSPIIEKNNSPNETSASTEEQMSNIREIFLEDWLTL
jgi:hypothetical protein